MRAGKLTNCSEDVQSLLGGYSEILKDPLPGSVFVFPYYGSDAVHPELEDTEIAITNLHISDDARVHLFLISSNGVLSNSSCIHVGAGLTERVKVSDLDLGNKGFILGVTTDIDGKFMAFNFLKVAVNILMDGYDSYDINAFMFKLLRSELPGENQVLKFEGDDLIEPQLSEIGILNIRSDSFVAFCKLDGDLELQLTPFSSLNLRILGNGSMNVFLNPRSCHLYGVLSDIIPESLSDILPTLGTGRLWAGCSFGIAVHKTSLPVSPIIEKTVEENGLRTQTVSVIIPVIPF